MRKPEEIPPNKARNIDPSASLATASLGHVDHRLIQQKQLRKKLGEVSSMWLFRHKDKLPTPMLIAGRRFWLEEEVDAFIERLSSKRNPEKTQHAGDAYDR